MNVQPSELIIRSKLKYAMKFTGFYGNLDVNKRFESGNYFVIWRVYLRIHGYA
jgi:hypothetical protein